MDETAINKKYDDLTNQGLLPLVFKNITIEDPQSNHELVDRSHFASPKFNTRLMNFQYIDRTFIV